MRKIILTVLLAYAPGAFAQDPRVDAKAPETTTRAKKNEVFENQTLKALSGSLSTWSWYSAFTYRGGSLLDPIGAARPNILEAEESVGLADLSGNMGVKYRLTDADNVSLQVGVYSTAPFHSTIETDNPRTRRDFDANRQRVDADDPTLSYFRTYTIGGLQNVSFVKYQLATRGVYRDYGLRSAVALSHAAAYKLNKFSYAALSLTYESYQFDKETGRYMGREISLLPFQTEHKLRGSLSGEAYLKRDLSVRLITDLFSLYRMRRSADVETRGLQQTLALTYFFSRDISLSPNIHFLFQDPRPERTNLGLSFNMNI